MALVKINGFEVEVPDGTNMIEAAKKVGVEIPHYCYHPHLSIAGNCRMCTVDVEAGGRGPDVACNMGARDGLAIRTDTEQVAQIRKATMEFMLVNHPLDCPICDQAGECRLQDYYMEHGNYESRLSDAKVSKEKRQDIGEHIVLDSERCVACSRCVRFGDEITETGELRLFDRGDHTHIGIFPGEKLSHQYQGNLADVCPVGALTNKDFRFEKRVWYLREQDSICSGCATGCNITVCHEQGHVFRLMPRRNDEVNQSWMCDPGRMSYKRVGAMNRLLRARVDAESVSLEVALEALAKAAATGEVGIVLGTQETNEANWAALQLSRMVPGGARLFHVSGNDPDAVAVADEFLVSEDANPNTAGVKLLAEHAEAGDAEALKTAVADGAVQTLIILVDDVVGRLDIELSGVGTVAYLGTHDNRTAQAAGLVLPVAAHVAQDGTFTNKDGRVQRLQRAVHPVGDALPAYVVIDAIGAALGEAPGTTTAVGTFAQMAAEVPGLSGMTYPTIGTQGQLLGGAASSSSAAAPTQPTA